MIKNIVVLMILLSLAACRCSNVDCETGPPELSMIITDVDGTDPIATGRLNLEDINLRQLNSTLLPIGIYYLGVTSFTINNISSHYEMLVKNIAVDTFDVTTIESKGECCSSFIITDVKNDGKSLAFSPLMVTLK